MIGPGSMTRSARGLVAGLAVLYVAAYGVLAYLDLVQPLGLLNVLLSVAVVVVACGRSWAKSTSCSPRGHHPYCGHVFLAQRWRRTI